MYGIVTCATHPKIIVRQRQREPYPYVILRQKD
jgi:hypothetical protein